MHREIVGVMDSHAWVDHIDRDTLNNRRGNLRQCTAAQNIANGGKRRHNSSGYRGVVWYKGKWVAQIGHRRKLLYLGRFSTPEEAAIAYDAAARQLYGEFAGLNFPLN